MPVRGRGGRSAACSRRRKSRVQPLPEQRQPVQGFVAKHETHVAISHLATPAPHRRGRDLLLQQPIGYLGAVAAGPSAGKLSSWRSVSSRRLWYSAFAAAMW